MILSSSGGTAQRGQPRHLGVGCGLECGGAARVDSLVLLPAAREAVANLAPGAQHPAQVGQGLCVCVCVCVRARVYVCVCVCVTRTYIGWGIFFRALDCEDEAAHPQSACSQRLPGRGAEPGCGSARAVRVRALWRARESSWLRESRASVAK